jgi:hypothetical protein
VTGAHPFQSRCSSASTTPGASLIVTSNKPFSAWGEIFGDEVTAAAMIDRLVHHAEILVLKGDFYRLKDRDLARPARDEQTELASPTGQGGPASPARHPHQDQQQVAHFRPAPAAHISTGLDTATAFAQQPPAQSTSRAGVACLSRAGLLFGSRGDVRRRREAPTGGELTRFQAAVD